MYMYNYGFLQKIFPIVDGIELFLSLQVLVLDETQCEWILLKRCVILCGRYLKALIQVLRFVKFQNVDLTCS